VSHAVSAAALADPPILARPSAPDPQRVVLSRQLPVLAAQLAYYFFFALFPMLLVLIAIASFFPLSSLVTNTVQLLGPFVPPEVLAIVTDQLRKVSGGDQGGLLTLGMVAAIWSSSTAMTAIADTLNSAYDVEEGRPWWKVRLIAIVPDARGGGVHSVRHRARAGRPGRCQIPGELVGTSAWRSSGHGTCCSGRSRSCS
jgi:hypothetical protein